MDESFVKHMGHDTCLDESCHVDKRRRCHIDESCHIKTQRERWGAGVETQKNVRGEIGGWGRVPFNETYAPSLSTIYDGP